MIVIHVILLDMNNKLDYITIDFETANQYKNSACSVGLVRFIDGKEVDSCYSLIHPAKMYFIPEWTQEIHHISYEDVRNKPYFPEVWDRIVMPFMNQTPDLPLVAHNGNIFDIPVIKECCKYFGMELPKRKYFDSLVVVKKTWSELKSHRLTDLGAHFGIEYLAHDALEDSRTYGQLIKLAADKWKVNSVEELLIKCDININEL